MSHPLFEMLENADLIRENQVNLDKVKRLPSKAIFDLANQSTILTSAKELPREKTIFAQSASISLSGDSWPCQHIDCRLKNATQLAQLAALYSDKVYIRNYFAKYVDHLASKSKIPLDDLRHGFANDLIVISYLRPLIESSRVIPITPPNYCLHCLTTYSFGQDTEKRFKVAYKELLSRYSKETSATISLKNGRYHVAISGPENLLEHGTMHFFRADPPPYIEKNPELRDLLNSQKEISLSAKDLKGLKISSAFADSVAQNIIFELATSLSVNTTFVTEKSLDIDFIRSISGDLELEERNRIIQENLTCLVPFIQNIDPHKLITLREKEEESFILFRDGLNKAISEHQKQKTNFTTRDAQEIYSEFVQPQLAHLDATVKSAKRNLIKGTSIKVLSWAGAISFGLYTGFLPSSVAAMASALGLTKIIADLASDVLKNSNQEDQIRSENMYFLWKVKQLSE
ncbi:MAG: hypothetical protein ACOYZ6_18575 [Chloroflexota bacterium]